jgi:hypothetical protein
MQERPAKAWPASSDEFIDLFNTHEPVVFREGASRWLPGQGTDLGVIPWLVDTIGHRRVPVTVVLPGDGGLLGAHPGTVGSGKRSVDGHRLFSEFAAELRRPTDGFALYMQSVRVDAELPELQQHLALPLAHLPLRGEWRTWIGTGDHHVALHWDTSENFFCLLQGRKRFHLCPFDVLPSAYIGPLEGNEYGTVASVVDPRTPDLRRYPRFIEVLERSETIQLDPGDVLYLPCTWFHWVESIGVNVSVNYWMRDVPGEARRAAQDVFLRALLHLRSMPPHWRNFWKKLLDTFVFEVDGLPYPHLSDEDQGFAGIPTEKRLKQLRDSIQALAKQATADRMSQADLETGVYRLAPSVVMRYAGEGQVAMKDAGSGREQVVPATMIPALSQFVRPMKARDVVSMLLSDPALSEDDAVERLRKLVAAQLLIRCEMVGSAGPQAHS